MDEQVAQCSSLDSWLFWTIVPWSLPHSSVFCSLIVCVFFPSHRTFMIALLHCVFLSAWKRVPCMSNEARREWEEVRPRLPVCLSNVLDDHSGQTKHFKLKQPSDVNRSRKKGFYRLPIIWVSFRSGHGPRKTSIAFCISRCD